MSLLLCAENVYYKPIYQSVTCVMWDVVEARGNCDVASDANNYCFLGDGRLLFVVGYEGDAVDLEEVEDLVNKILITWNIVCVFIWNVSFWLNLHRNVDFCWQFVTDFYYRLG